MISQIGELYQSDRSNIEAVQGALPEGVLDIRLDFVKGMKWFPDDYKSDEDSYDRRQDTFHFVRRDLSGNIVATMRLTPVESIEQSLSYQMIAANHSFQDEVRNNQEKVDGDIWDLTRLVSPLDQLNSDESQEAIIELFGSAARISAGHIDNVETDVYWIFTTTPWMLRFFEKTGINSTVLGEGKLPDVNGKPKTTYFCLVDVAEAISALKTSENHQNTYELLRMGAGAVPEAEAA